MLVLFFYGGNMKALKNTTDEERAKALKFIIEHVDKIEEIKEVEVI